MKVARKSSLSSQAAWFYKLSLITYRVLGPRIVFKLALSPLGYYLFKLISGGRGTIQFTSKYGFKMAMSAYEYYMSGYLFLGETNPSETKIFRAMLAKGDTVIDAGAHLGWYSLNAAQIVGPSGKVIAFEPNPNCIESIHLNLKLNKFINVKVERSALSDTNGTAIFWFGDDMLGSLYKENAQSHVQMRHKIVRIQNLDTYCSENKIGKIKMIKVDVERAEEKLLHGAKKVLNKYSPDLIIEMLYDDDKTKKQRLRIIKFLSGMGYKFYAFTGRGLEEVKGFVLPKNVINMLFSKKDISV